MVGGSFFGPFFEASGELLEFEKLKGLVELEFEVEEGLVEFGVPTFYVRLGEDSKRAFLRLFRGLDPMGFAPVLRIKGGRAVLQVVRRRSVASRRWFFYVGLFLATVGTLLLAGYWQSGSWVEAVMFMAALMAILGAHEMGHKLVADRYGVEASYPYFIPGPPPFGTFGAVIRQESLAPNKDALFDLGAGGPIVGFLVTVLVSFLGVQMSVAEPTPLADVPPGTFQMPILLSFLVTALLRPPPVDPGSVLLVSLHPVAFAGWVGMLVTMLNMVPAGMLDGGHVAQGLLGWGRARVVFSFLGVFILLFFGHWLMAMMALFMSFQRHPGSLDDVSSVSRRRKLATLGLVSIFVLCAAPIWSFS